MMGRTVLIGGGGHAKVLLGLLNKMLVPVVGYTDPADRGTILGASWLGDDDALGRLLKTDDPCDAVMGVGKTDASSMRLEACLKIEAMGFVFPSIASPHAIVSEDVRIAAGSVVLDGVIINPGTLIGHYCILNTGCIVEHDCRLGDNVHVAPGVTLSGGVTIGTNSMIGVGSTVVQGVAISEGCLVRAGSTVTGDLSTPGVYGGMPCMRIR